MKHGRVLRSKRAVVVLLVDLLDASGTLPPRLRSIVGANPVLLLGTKLDLMPPGIAPDALRSWLERAATFKGLQPLAVMLVRGRHVCT